MPAPHIVVVSDSASIRETLVGLLAPRGAVTAYSVSEFAARSAGPVSVAVIVTDAVDAAGSFAHVSSRAPVVSLRSESTGAPFDVAALFADVDRAISPNQPNPAGIAYPEVTLDVARALERARSGAFPVLVAGEPGTGKSRVARSLAGGAEFLTVDAAGLTSEHLRHLLASLPLPATVYVTNLEQLPEACDAAMQDLAATRGRRLVCSSTHAYGALQDRFARRPGLLASLGVLTLVLPPLRERPNDLGALIDFYLQRAQAGGAPVRFSGSAVDRLKNNLWIGNLTELESVVVHSAVFAAGNVIEAVDIRYPGERREREPSVGPQVVPATQATPPRDSDLDLLIVELAHEFKNPMVVVKTASQHLERLLADDPARREVAQMANGAVDQMDRVLENLVRFSQFEEPTPAPVQIGEVLSSCLANLADEIAEKKIVIDFRPPSAMVQADGPQLAFVCENLLRVMIRDAQPGTAITIRPRLSGAGFALEMPASRVSISRNLAGAVGAEGGAARVLGIRLAESLVIRNGGRVDLARDDERQVIEVELSAGGGVQDEETARFDS